MPACVLRISGPHADVAAAVQGAFVEFVESRATERARERGEASVTDPSTFNFTVSDADGDHVPLQIVDAEEFVSTHLAELIELLSRPGVEGGILDFGWDIPHNKFMQWNRFPSSFLALCAEAKLDIEVSVYVVTRDR